MAVTGVSGDEVRIRPRARQVTYHPPGIRIRVAEELSRPHAGMVLGTFERYQTNRNNGGYSYALYIAQVGGGFCRYPGLVSWDQVQALLPDPRKWPLPAPPAPPGSRSRTLQPVATSATGPTSVARPRERKRVSA